MQLISVTLAVESLTEQCATVDETRAILRAELGTRDNLIRDMRAAGVMWKKLIQITRLTRQQLTRIVDSPRYIP